METVPNSSGREASAGRTKPIVRVRAKVVDESAQHGSRARRRPRNRRSQNRPAQASVTSTASDSRVTDHATELLSAPAWLTVSRAVALFLGLLTLLNLFGDFHLQKLDANFWWINLQAWPVPVARGVLATTAVLLILFAAQVQTFRAVRYLTILVLLTLLAVTVKNIFQFYALVKAGTIETMAPFPVSVYSALMLAVIFWGLLLGPRIETSPLRTLLLGTFTFLLCLAGFPIAQMYCSGQTDLESTADVAVIFGAPVAADGEPSAALVNAVWTGSQLYQQGRVKKLILSGGPGRGDVSETSAMQQLALQFDVPKKDLLLDAEGTTIENSIRNVTALLDKQEQTELLAVSAFYQLPRIQLGFDRSALQVATVPATTKDAKPVKPKEISREVVALWKAYFKSIIKQ